MTAIPEDGCHFLAKIL